MFGANAAGATIPLSKKNSMGQNPTVKIAKADGTVTGLDTIPGTGPKLAIVFAGGTDLEDVQQPQVMGVGQNTALIGAMGLADRTTYKLDFDVRAKSLFALGGVLDMTGNPDFTHIGFVGGIVPVEGQTITQDIAVNIPLDQDLVVTVTGDATLTDIDTVALLQAPNDGGQIFAGTGSGSSVTIKTPALTGALAGASIRLFVEGVTADGSSEASTIVAATGNAANVALPGRLAAPTNMGRRLMGTANTGSTFHNFEINTTNGDTVWEITLFGDLTTATLPAVPMGVTDPISGTMDVTFTSHQASGIDLNSTKFDNLGKAVPTRRASTEATLVF